MQSTITAQSVTELVFIEAELALQVESLVSGLFDYMLSNALDYAFYAEGDFLLEAFDGGDSIVAMFEGEMFFNRRSLVNAIIDFVS